MRICKSARNKKLNAETIFIDLLRREISVEESVEGKSRLGLELKKILTKLWIWVVAVMLFVIGLGGGDKVVLYRIVYMALFLIFILTFQVSL